ncbi:MAG: hypothetical protein ABIW47_14250 [Ginsengibacter sp.]|jgi:hypothetical protein
MKKNFLFLIFSGVLLSCNNNTRPPDVSSIKVELLTRPFEQDFFAMDTANIGTSLEKIMQKYPGFTGDFIYNILGLNLDSMIHGNKEQQMAVKQFIRDYMPIKDSADVLYKDFKKYSGEIQKGLQYVKYYFPDYQLPKSVITFVGPLDANFQTSFGVQGDVLTPDGLGIGLQLHLGGDFSFYKSAAGQSLYPAFISENFDADHIPINSMRNIADDLFEDKSSGKPLIEQMVEKGRFLFLISKFLPAKPDYMLIGYTKIQMDAAKENEGVIWSFFLNNDLLNTQEQDIIKNYIGESPKTAEFGDNAPGNLGSFAGWQIVKKFMDKYPETSLKELMQMDARDIYGKSKYKPRN